MCAVGQDDAVEKGGTRKAGGPQGHDEASCGEENGYLMALGE